MAKDSTSVTSGRAALIAQIAALLAGLAGGPALAADPAPDGKAAFVARCAMCHQANGNGLAGQFPKLTGRAAAIAAAPAGRRYMARVVLHGMAGPIEVEGARIAGVMPGMSTLSDAEIAAILSHTLTLGAAGGKPAKGLKPFTTAEIAAVRADGKASMADNRTLRTELVGSGVIK
ncbi:c-type cytochrome [Sandarakinorhabdus rubra]|uniref:c-type cytochrome n=1 Tax=Sandarakinorhabdus rubra TaxID=2672568 RepID=UPI001F4247A2|nr:cytochrome c [Sandarakinorhabdus rubra]